MKKIKRFVSKRIVFPLATLKWKVFHPKILPRLGMKFIIDPQVVPYYITNKKTFQRLLPLFDFFVNENSIVLDIGASFGFYSIYSSKIRNAKKVIAFEPTKRSYDLFLKNIDVNDARNIVVHRVAVGEEKKKAKLYYEKNCFGGNSLMGKGARYELVEVVPVDSLVPHADFIKMDVEGAEYDALMGMKQLLVQSKPPLIFESSRNDGHIRSLLASLGYIFPFAIGHNVLAVHHHDEDKINFLRKVYEDFQGKTGIRINLKKLKE